MEELGCGVGVAATPFMTYAIFREAFVVASAGPLPLTLRLTTAGRLAPTMWLWRAARVGNVLMTGTGFQDQTLLWLRRVASVGMRALPDNAGILGLHQAALVASLDLIESGVIQRTDDLLDPKPVYTRRLILE
jgi:hypothetical protein